MISEVAKRRTFAIISHPDAGKTTLTEKFLLYGGALQLAGSVTARKNQRAATSDWMELEKKRGISVSSTVLQFEYKDFVINLLDTPGHKDFSEDTYRVLTAVDAVVMIIDAGKGIEAQTRKLFEICRMRQIPIFTFINKMDRPSRPPLELLDELEKVLEIEPFPINWPLGSGTEFKGVFDRIQNQVHLFERTPGGAFRAPLEIHNLSDPSVKDRLAAHVYTDVCEEIEILDIMGTDIDHPAILQGKVSPVFFGSAANNFGVQLILDYFLKLSPPPAPRVSSSGETIPVAHEKFSGFIFKIQANMDPKHRDRIAFLRVCSGRFTRDLMVSHSRTGKTLRLSSSHKLFGQDRETVDEAFAGDIIGIVGHSDFGIGDTLTEDPSITYNEIPRFAPEHFAYLQNPNTSKFKQFRTGLDQLLQEGAVQVFYIDNAIQKVPLLGAVGPLQFEVVQYRLETEYNAPSRLETTNWSIARWLPADFPASDLSSLKLPSNAKLAEDSFHKPVILFSSEWEMHYFSELNPNTSLHEIPQ